MESVRFKINCDVATVHFDDGTPTPSRGAAVNTVNTRSPRELRASAIELNDSSDLPVGGDETLRPPACEIVRHRNTIAKAAAAATLVLACSAPATA